MTKKIHRFITEYIKSHGSIEITDTDIIHQMINVLKLRVGEECIIVGKNGEDVVCVITELRKDFIKCNIQEVKTNDSEPQKEVTLYMAILKKENFEWVVEKASEIGIAKIVPVVTTRTVKTGLNFERINKIAREASELSGRSSVIQIDEITTLKEALQTDPNIHKVLFDISGEKANNKQLEAKSLSIYIGPEGGFTAEELALAKEHDISIASLGSLTLRGETAAIIACYLALQ